MKTRCPCCGAENSLDALLAKRCGRWRRLAANWGGWQRINRNWRRCANYRQMQRRRVVTVKTIERREIYENA